MIDKMFLFRTDLRIYEDYHYCKTYKEFKQKCWDFYINQGLWALENNVLHEFVVWRLKPKNNIIDVPSFTLDNGNIFKQIFVDSFEEIYQMNYGKVLLGFFRGGFKCYDLFVNKKFSKIPSTVIKNKIYCGSGCRIFPEYCGSYDVYLLESEKDLNSYFNCCYFYKTANPNIFYNMNIPEKKYDICFPANFSSIKYKGQRFFIQEISKSKFLKSLNIVSVGNNVKDGKKICQEYNVNNITFLGHLNREGVNEILNQSKFGLVCSNANDGCPRVISEILCSGTPLIIRNKTRLLQYYKKYGVIEFSDDNFSNRVKKAFSKYKQLKKDLNNNINRFSMNTICMKNFDIWYKKSK